jgi:hypothetical protein
VSSSTVTGPVWAAACGFSTANAAHSAGGAPYIRVFSPAAASARDTTWPAAERAARQLRQALRGVQQWPDTAQADLSAATARDLRMILRWLDRS